MIRTQIQFPQDDWSRLRRLASQEGISVSELVRRCVTRATEDAASTRRAAYQKAASVAGKFRDREGSTDLSAHHDRHLDEAFD